MNPLWRNEEFCRDTFAEALPAGFRDETISRMSRARRRVRHAHAAKLICAAAALFILAWQFHSTSPQAPAVARMQPRLVPLKMHTIALASIIHTEALDPQMLVRSSAAEVAIVHTGARGYDEISNEQMLEALRGQSIALIRVNGVTRLEFLDREVHVH
jgi:hypothetical protein